MTKAWLSGFARLWGNPHSQPKRGSETQTPSSLVEWLSDPKRRQSEEVAGQLRARQVNAIQRLGIPLMIVNLVNICTLLLELHLTDQLSGLTIAWSTATGAVAIGVLVRSFLRRKRDVPHTTSRATIRRVIRSSLLFGLLWSVPGIAILPQLSGMALAFSTALLTGMIAGGAIVLYPVPAAAISFVVPVAASAVLGLILSHGWFAVGPAVLAVAFLYIFLGVVRRHSDLFVSEFVARIDLEQRNRLIEDLLEDVRLEALGARRLAEDQKTSKRTSLAVGQVTAGMAHYFNNLLTVLRGNAELLAQNEDTDRTLIRPILAACDRGTSAVRRLLSAAEKQSLKPQAVALDDVVGQLQQAFQASVGPRIRVLAKVEDQPCTALVDREELETALFEVLQNASDAIADAGEIVIACRNVADSAACSPDCSAVSVGVRDTGCGMDEVARRQAVEPFFTTRKTESATGLGLSAAAGFARQSGGSLQIESWPGIGTSVTLYLPRDCKTDAGGSERPGDGKVSVLLVESDPDLRTSIETMLGGLGYLVFVANNAEDALRLLSDKNDVDLVMTNILLLGPISGIQLGRMVHDSKPTTKMLFVSQFSTGRPGPSSVGTGAPVLAHPFTRAELETHLRRTLAETNNAFA